MRVCKNCGAKLQAAAPGSTVRCPFCGAEEQVALVSAFHGVSALTPQVMPPTPKWARVFPFIFIPLVIAGFGAYIALSVRSEQARFEQAQAANRVAPAPDIDGLIKQSEQPKSPKVNLSNIATIPFEGWETLDVPGWIGTFDAFDVVANYEWASKIVVAWKPDGAIMRIDVDRVGRDGLVNLKATPDAQVWYRAFSPKCIKDYTESTSLVDPKLKCELFIQLKADSGVVLVSALKTGDSLSSIMDDKAIKSPVCTLQQAFAKLDKAKKLPTKPVFNANLYDVGSGNERYARWNIDQIISGMDTVGYLNATTCAIE